MPYAVYNSRESLDGSRHNTRYYHLSCTAKRAPRRSASQHTECLQLSHRHLYYVSGHVRCQLEGRLMKDEPHSASGQRSDYCEKAAQAFVQAGQILSNLFAINTVINVNVTLRPFSAANGDNVGLLAAAGPQLSIPLVGDDGVTRYYPSALVKQFKLPGAEFTDTDISVLVKQVLTRTQLQADALTAIRQFRSTNAAPATQPQLYVGDYIIAPLRSTQDRSFSLWGILYLLWAVKLRTSCRPYFTRFWWGNITWRVSAL